jgi:hypothetical protein
MKYIFIVGTPGSKWSSVAKNIYYSPSIDNSDYSEDRTYHHDASGETQLMHLGAYFDPGMEFGDFFDKLDCFTKEECEVEFDRPFSDYGIRIVKSHVFAHHIDFLKENWPDCPIVLVHRADDACLGWWVRCGEFNITYPSYESYYKDLRNMAKIIDNQNRDIIEAWQKYEGTQIQSNKELAQILGIMDPGIEYFQNYSMADVRVKVI